MSTPVVASQWAGTFDCGTCRRKRLMGEEFSKKALEKYRKNGNSGTLKCKRCVTANEQAERDAAAERRKTQQQQKNQQGGDSNDGGNNNSNDNNNNSDDETRICAACSKTVPKSAFNRNQWSKGERKSRCRDCVDQAVQQESKNQDNSKEKKIEEARKNVDEARKGGNPARILAAESELTALEAERVTGLKPIKLSSGRGGRGRGRGRGRSGRLGGGRGRGKGGR